MKFKYTVIAIALAIVSAPTLALSPQHEQVTKLFQGDSEPAAKDAVWTQGNIFKVGVLDDGSDRSGYANYVCQILYDHGFKGKKVWVQVVDIVELSRNGKWTKLGETHCL